MPFNFNKKAIGETVGAMKKAPKKAVAAVKGKKHKRAYVPPTDKYIAQRRKEKYGA